MNDYPTTLRVIAAFKAGEDLAQRLESAIKAQNAMADALRNAADEIERLQEIVAGYTHGISADAESNRSYEQNDEKRMNTNMSYTIDKKAYEGDIVSRLRNWRGLHLAHSGGLFESAADEIERLRNGAVEGRETVRLTDAEREAVKWFSQLSYGEGGRVPDYAAALRKLLERTECST